MAQTDVLIIGGGAAVILLSGVHEKGQLKRCPFIRKKDGGARRNRTADLLNAIQALSQLSYGP